MAADIKTCFLCVSNFEGLDQELSTNLETSFLLSLILKLPEKSLHEERFQDVVYCSDCVQRISKIGDLLEDLEKLENLISEKKYEIEVNFKRGSDPTPNHLSPPLGEFRKEIINGLRQRNISKMMDKVNKKYEEPRLPSIPSVRIMSGISISKLNENQDGTVSQQSSQESQVNSSNQDTTRKRRTTSLRQNQKTKRPRRQQKITNGVGKYIRVAKPNFQCPHCTFYCTRLRDFQLHDCINTELYPDKPEEMVDLKNILQDISIHHPGIEGDQLITADVYPPTSFNSDNPPEGLFTSDLLEKGWEANPLSQLEFVSIQNPLESQEGVGHPSIPGPSKFGSGKKKRRKHESNKCYICHQEFHTVPKLVAHMSTEHEGQPSYSCEYCEYKCETAPILKSHFAHRHAEGREFKCRVCNMAFKSRANMDGHIRDVHIGTRTYQCDFCSASFKRGNALKVHTRLHTGEKPFVCKLCGQGFSRNANLQIHNRKPCSRMVT